MTDFKIGDLVYWNCRSHKIVRVSAVVLESVDGTEHHVPTDSCTMAPEKAVIEFVARRRAHIQAKIDALAAERDSLK